MKALCFRFDPRPARSLALVAGLAALAACAPDRRGAAPGGQLHISTDPAGAQVICDGVPAPDPTPITLTGLAPGDHLVIAGKLGHADARVTATLRPGERQALDLKLEPISGLVLVHSTPPGAEVDIDGASYGKTPLLVKAFPLGRHRLTLTAPGFMPKSVNATVEDRTPQIININLKSDFAKVLFESKPAGAQVTIDGAAVGRTPCEAPRLASGKHRLAMALDGHQPHADEFVVQAGEERAVKVILTPRPARLAAVTLPPRARLYLNGQYRGETPFTADRLPPGDYALRVELAGYAPQTRAVTLGPGAEAVEEFQLVKDSGALLISTEPPEVAVFLDGENRGTTRALDQAPISAQLTLDLVPRGAHKLQLTKPGYFDQTATVDISNQTAILHYKLTPRPVRFVPTTIVRTGPGAEHAFRGVIRERFANGDLKLELEPGIFKTFKASEIQSIEALKLP